MILTESVVEEAALTWLESLGYVVKHGPVVAPGEPATEWLVSGELRAHMEKVA